jgi:hypothetical protein
MQGTAADLIKLAMMAVQARLDAEKPRCWSSCRCMTNWCSSARVRQGLGAGRDPAIMAGVADLSVPLLAEIGFGSSWEKGALSFSPKGALIRFRPGAPRSCRGESLKKRAACAF